MHPYDKQLSCCPGPCLTSLSTFWVDWHLGSPLDAWHGISIVGKYLT